MQSTIEQQANAARGAQDALRNILRIDAIKDEHRDLTDAQGRDFEAACRSYIAAAEILPELPALNAAEIGRDWLTRASRALNIVAPMYEMRARLDVDPQTRWLVDGSLSDPESGRAAAKPRDELRAMLDAGERSRNFDLVRGFEETRAIAEFSDNASLYTSDFASRVAMFLRTESPWMRLATVVRADNGRPLVVPEITADATTYTPGEGTAITESTPTLGSATVTLTSYKTLSYIGQESYEDAEYDISSYIAQSAARSIAQSFGTAATTAVLAGINNAGTASGVGGTGTATTSFVGYEDLIDLEMSRAAPYRASGAWVFSNGAIKKVRKFRDGQGNYLWPSENLAAGQPSAFEGHPVYEDPNLANVASASKSFLFGDWGSALVIKATNLRVATSSDFRFSNDQIAIKVVLRAGIAVQDPIAAAYLVSATS